MGARNSKRPVWYDEFHACERVIDQREIAKCELREHWQHVILMSRGKQLTGHALEQTQLAHRFLFKRVLIDLVPQGEVDETKTIQARKERVAQLMKEIGNTETNLLKKQRLQVLMNAKQLSATCMEELLNDFGVSVWVWKASKIKTA